MRSKFDTALVTFLLVFAGVSSIGWRLFTFDQSRFNRQSTWWRLNYRIDIDSDRPDTKVQVAIPTDTPTSRVFRENLSFGDLIANRTKQVSGTSLVSFTTRRSGRQVISAQFDLEISQSQTLPRNPKPETASAAELSRFLRSTPTIQSQSDIVLDTIKRLRGERDPSMDPVRQIFEFCSNQIEEEVEGEASSNARGVLADMVGTELGRAKTMVALCRADNIHARVVTGFQVSEESEMQPRFWVETLREKIWQQHDLQRGHFAGVPRNYLPIRIDGDSIVFLSDAERAEVLFSCTELSAQDAAYFGNQSPAQILDLTRLPSVMHPVLAVILLIPLGAFVTSIFQVIVGIRTIGTFSPTLIAVSFVMADWRTGAAVFALVIFVGLISRASIERLRLLMVPKLSFILTLVVVILVFTISILDYLRLTPSPQAVLLPMVILTMTIERFYVVTAEEGLKSAFGLLINTIIVSFVCFLTVGWRQVGELVMAFPEVHFFTLAAIVFVGRYNGYRVSELWRFRDLRTDLQSTASEGPLP